MKFTALHCTTNGAMRLVHPYPVIGECPYWKAPSGSACLAAETPTAAAYKFNRTAHSASAAAKALCHAAPPSLTSSNSSIGYRSGRSSWRDTPVAFSMGITYSPGTLPFERLSQFQTCICFTPMRRASSVCEPASATARWSGVVIGLSSFNKTTESIKQLLLSSQNICSLLNYNKCCNVSSMALGQNIKRLRKAQGLSQDQLAAKAGGGITQGIIAALEKRDSETSKHAARIAAALGVSVDQ